MAKKKTPTDDTTPKAEPEKILTQADIVSERTREQGHYALKRKVRIFYDLQRLRLQTAGRGAAQITIQVQAMDSRSFLDHRDEIAQAVREAMLNSHSLNDVVSEL